MIWTSNRPNQNSYTTAGAFTSFTSKPRTARLGQPTPTSCSYCHTHGCCVWYLRHNPDADHAWNALQRTFRHIRQHFAAAAHPCMCTYCHVLCWPACVLRVSAGTLVMIGSMRWFTQKTSPNAYGSHHSKFLLTTRVLLQRVVVRGTPQGLSIACCLLGRGAVSSQPIQLPLLAGSLSMLRTFPCYHKCV
jgi:hypothetical protein